MCFYIDSRSVLANILISFSRIKSEHIIKFRNVLNSILPNIYVDISDDSVWSAIENNPWLFSLDDEEITRANNHNDIWNYEYINKTINKPFSIEIRNALTQASHMIKDH